MEVTPHIVSIVYTPAGDYDRPVERYLRVPISSADLVAGRGIRGDRKGSNSNRALNLMSAETLAVLANEGFKTSPGQMGEQIVIAGLDFSSLIEGTRLQLGDAAVIEFVQDRTGCERFERIQGKSPSTVAGRLGFMACVITGGHIAAGDAVRVYTHASN